VGYVTHMSGGEKEHVQSFGQGNSAVVPPVGVDERITSDDS
jgi:hypothetical protein